MTPRAVVWQPLVYTNNPTLPKPSSKEKAMCEIPHRLQYSFQANKIKLKDFVVRFSRH